MNDFNQLTMIQKGSVLLDQGRYKDAIKIFKDGLSQNPESPLLLYLLAFAQYHIGEQKKQALETINQALAFENQNPDYYELKALILADLKRIKEAREAVEHALSIDSASVHAHTISGYIYGREEKWAEAEACAREALSIDADDQFAANILANALRMQNKLDEGTHLASDMLAKDPDNSMSHSSAGWVYLHKKDYDKASMHFKEALRLDPNFEPARAGMLEAFKAKSWIYRLYLDYCIFMTRQSKSTRIFIILGIYFLFRTVSRNFDRIFQGRWVVLGYGIIIFFYLFFFWSWLASGIGNLLVLKDKVARYALNRNERLDAIFVGANFLAGLIVGVIGFVAGFTPMKAIGVAMILSTIPFAVTFKNDHPKGRRLYGGVGGFILVSGVVLGICFGLLGESVPAPVKIASGISLLLFILTTWLGAFGFWRE